MRGLTGRRAADHIRDALFPPGAMDTYARVFFDKTRELVREKVFPLVGLETYSVDIVRDVVNLVPVHWASTLVRRARSASRLG